MSHLLRNRSPMCKRAFTGTKTASPLDWGACSPYPLFAIEGRSQPPEIRAGDEYRPQSLARTRVPQFPQGGSFYLADPFAADAQLFADLVPSPLHPVIEAVSQGYDFSLSRAECLQSGCDLLP